MKKTIDSFVFHCEYEKKLSHLTLKAYKIDLEQFKNFIRLNFGDIQIHEIKKLNIKAYIQHLSKHKAKTIKRKLATIKAMFNFLEFEEELDINPFRKIRINIKEPKNLPVVLSLKEVELILKSVYEKINNIANRDSYLYKQTIRDIAVIELLFATGVRVSKLCSLKIVNISNGFSNILVNGKGNKQRFIEISSPETQDILKKYYYFFKESIYSTGYFFINRIGVRLSEQSVRFTIKKYCKDIILGKIVTPHVFRHTFATLLLEEDVDIRYIQNLLGHSSINITQIYTHVSTKKQKDIILSKHPRKNIHFSIP